ncbi:D-alanyl-D-alanine carboxypeptidase family protein, partial [Aquabacterium sp.]
MFAPRAAAMPAVPEVAARAFILQDVGSRQTLGERQADQPLPPASLTKLMSAYLVFQALESGKLKSDQSLTVSDKAWRAGLNGAVRIAAAPNATLRVDDLIRAMTVLNANDATIALAE